MCQCDCGQLLRRLNRRSTDEAIVLNQASSGGKTLDAVETVDDASRLPGLVACFVSLTVVGCFSGLEAAADPAA